MRSVYFVVQREYLLKNHALELESGKSVLTEHLRPEHLSPEHLYGHFRTGVDCWTLKTWALLQQEDLPFKVVLTDFAPPGEVCVFHYDHARPECGVHQCVAVVAQADRPSPPLADILVVQNRLSQDALHKYFVPHWPQDRLIARDPARGDILENVAFMGNKEYLPAFFHEPDFNEALDKADLKVLWRSVDDWHNYSDVDVVLAMRHLPPVVERTKPALKLVNAWLAGVPAILTPEPAYQEQRQSELDYLEANNAFEALGALRRLKNSPELYQAMIANGRQRVIEFDEAATKKAWVTLLEKVLQLKESLGPQIPALRWARYHLGKIYTHAWKRVVGWQD